MLTEGHVWKMKQNAGYLAHKENQLEYSFILSRTDLQTHEQINNQLWCGCIASEKTTKKCI